MSQPHADGNDACGPREQAEDDVFRQSEPESTEAGAAPWEEEEDAGSAGYAVVEAA